MVVIGPHPLFQPQMMEQFACHPAVFHRHQIGGAQHFYRPL